MGTREQRAAYWNRVANEKQFSHPLDLRLLRRHLGRDATILDYGCGYGRLVSELRRVGFRHVLGIDPASRMIERGRALFPELDLRLVPEPCHAHLRSGFGAILLFSVLTCTPDDAELEGLAAGLARLLAPGGLLYASDLVIQDDARNRARYDEAFAEAHRPYGTFRLDEGVVLRHYAPARVRSLFSALEEVSWRTLRVVTMNGHAARAFQYVGRKPLGSQARS